jgi:hypothetical protein
MSEEKDEKSPVKEAAAKAAVDLAKQAYEDGAQPLVRNAGQLIALPFRLLNAGLANVYALLTDHEAQRRALEKAMNEHWARIPPERLVAPPANIAGPLLLNYAFVQEEKDAPLRALYEQLLASAMDSEAQPDVHPAFVDMLKQMTPLEAQLMSHLASLPGRRAPLVRTDLAVRPNPGTMSTVGINHPFPYADDERRFGEALDNLERLKIVNVTFERSIPGAAFYAELRDAMKDAIAPPDRQLQYVDGLVVATQLGRSFIRACIPLPPPAVPDLAV